MSRVDAEAGEEASVAAPAEASSASRIAGWIARGGLRFAAIVYGLGARVHRRFMASTSAGRGRLACAVVSVGGLTVGGAGKTPVAARLALGLRRRGWRVVLASRGYGGRDRTAVAVVSDGTHIHSNVTRSGDECLVLAAHAPGVPVLVGRDRRVVGHHAVSAFDAEIVVLDDGFQHHRLARDLDLVCIDGAGGFGNHRLLPAGPLREPISALRHADWICVVDSAAEGASEVVSGPGLPARDVEIVSKWAEAGGEILRAKRAPIDLRALDGSEVRAVESLRGRRVGLLSGIGRPESLRRTLEALGGEVVVERRFRDHHAYSARDFEGFDEAGLVWITTEKDGLKILPEWIGAASLWILRIEVAIEEEEAVLERLEARLQSAGRLAERPRRTAHEGESRDALSAGASG